MIAGGGAAVAGLGVVALTPLGNPVKSKAREVLASSGLGRSMLSLADGTMAEWQAQVGSTFAVGGGTTMRLAGVRAMNSGGERPDERHPPLGLRRLFRVARRPVPARRPDLHGQPFAIRADAALSLEASPGRRMLAVFN